MIHDKMENLLYFIPPTQREKVEEFVKEISIDMPDGKYDIDDDNVFARIMTYDTKLPEKCEIEAHDIYCDIQFVLLGSEGISIFQRNELMVESVNKQNDFVVFKKEDKIPYISIHNLPGYFTLIIPSEAHRPQESIDGSCKVVKKGVIKIKESCYE